MTSRSILDTLRILLKNEGFEVATAQGGKAGLEQLQAFGARHRPDRHQDAAASPASRSSRRSRSRIRRRRSILMTAQASLQSAIQAVNEGAFHYVQKPFSNDEIVALCRRAAEVRRLKAENKQLKQEIRAPRAVGAGEAARQGALVPATCCVSWSRWPPPKARC